MSLHFLCSMMTSKVHKTSNFCLTGFFYQNDWIDIQTLEKQLFVVKQLQRKRIVSLWDCLTPPSYLTFDLKVKWQRTQPTRPASIIDCDLLSYSQWVGTSVCLKWNMSEAFGAFGKVFILCGTRSSWKLNSNSLFENTAHCYSNYYWTSFIQIRAGNSIEITGIIPPYLLCPGVR